MLIVGGADRRVPPAQGRALDDALNERKIDHEWLYRRTEGHGFYNEKLRTEMYEKMLAFLNKHIGAGNDATIEK
jgi:dipeptidyl aminopeptidase/acylaminoacyl peptidase